MPDRQYTLNDPDNSTHVFIIRVWFEPRQIEGAAPLMRGVVESLPEMKSQYFLKVEEIVDIINRQISQQKEQGSDPNNSENYF